MLISLHSAGKCGECAVLLDSASSHFNSSKSANTVLNTYRFPLTLIKFIHFYTNSHKSAFKDYLLLRKRVTGPVMEYPEVREELYGRAKRTKKAPRPILYDPISHSQREFRYEAGRVVPSPRSPANSSLQHASFSTLSLPRLRAPPQASTAWLSHSTSSFPKTKVRTQVFNPITGFKASFEPKQGVLGSLGNPARWVAPSKEGKGTLGDGRRAPVAYISPFLI